MSKEAKNEEALFYEAMDLAAGEREAFLVRACGEDAELLERLKALLAVRDREYSFVEAVSTGFGPGLREVDPEPPGTVIARYKLIEKIGEEGSFDLWVSKRISRDHPWGQPASLGSPVNSRYSDASPSLTRDGRILFFRSSHPGGFGESDIWFAVRESVESAWSEPINCGPAVNTMFAESNPRISPDGSVLYVNVMGGKGRLPDTTQGRDGHFNLDVWSAEAFLKSEESCWDRSRRGRDPNVSGEGTD